MSAKLRATILNDIATHITTNGAGEITGAELKGILDDFADSIPFLSHIIKVRVVATANVTIATGLNSGDTLNGVTLANGDIVLLPMQTTTSQNGIYVVSASPARHGSFSDYNSHCGAMVVVGNEGTAYKNTIWLGTSSPGGTLGTTAIVFTNQSVELASSTVAGISEGANSTEADAGVVGDGFHLTPENLGPKSAFKATKTAGSNQTIATGASFTKVSFAAETFDIGSNFDLVTNDRWTPPAGLVLLACNITWASAVNNTAWSALILKNGASTVTIVDAIFVGTGAQGEQIAGIDNANGTDFYEVWVRQQSGGNLDVFGTTNVFFSGVRLR